jgi:hypothetical protein
LGGVNHRGILFIAIGVAFAVRTTVTAGDASAGNSVWVYAQPDGKLGYKRTANGDRIMDFSHAGYRGGGVALPDVPVKVTVQPDFRYGSHGGDPGSD